MGVKLKIKKSERTWTKDLWNKQLLLSRVTRQIFLGIILMIHIRKEVKGEFNIKKSSHKNDSFVKWHRISMHNFNLKIKKISIFEFLLSISGYLIQQIHIWKGAFKFYSLIGSKSPDVSDLREKSKSSRGLDQTNKGYTSVWFRMGTFSAFTEISAGKAECHSCRHWIARIN